MTGHALHITEYNYYRGLNSERNEKCTKMNKQNWTENAMRKIDSWLISLERCCFNILLKISMEDASLIFCERLFNLLDFE